MHRDGEDLPEKNEPTERLETTSYLYLHVDGVTADDLPDDDAGDLEDALPAEVRRFDDYPGYDPDAHNAEIETFLRSLGSEFDAPVEVPPEELGQAWQVTTEAAMNYLDQGPVYADEFGANTRTDVIPGNDDYGHDLEVSETPADRVDEECSMFKVTVQRIGDEMYSGAGAGYRVGDDGVVYRHHITAHPQDAAPQPPETIVDVPVGLDEVRRLARLLLGRDVTPEEY